jgi:voltage-gated potassium channel
VFTGQSDSEYNGPDPPESWRSHGAPWQQIVRSALRAAGSASVLVAIYYLLPLNTSIRWAAITILLVGLILLIVLIAFQVRWILTSPFPGLRAVEALATSVPLFLLLFASTYVVIAKISASNFSQPLSRTDALYFTVTVFSTVGFGDITAKSQAARLVVTAQMIADLVILGVAIKVIVGAVRRVRSARP